MNYSAYEANERHEWWVHCLHLSNRKLVPISKTSLITIKFGKEHFARNSGSNINSCFLRSVMNRSRHKPQIKFHQYSQRLDDLGLGVRVPKASRLFTSPHPPDLSEAHPASQPPIQWIPDAVSQGIKCPGGETDRSPSINSEITKTWIYISTNPNVFLAQCLITWEKGQLPLLSHLFSLPYWNELLRSRWLGSRYIFQ